MARFKGKKGRAWELVKKIVRLQGKDCYTCEAKNITSYNAQAGHYQPVALSGSNGHLAWDLRFIKLQCGRCNGAGQGQQGIYRKKLVKEFGEKVVAEYDWQVMSKKAYPIKNWEELIESYKKIINEIDGDRKVKAR